MQFKNAEGNTKLSFPILNKILIIIIVLDKGKIIEEKFQKLKDVYAKLREEHIALIRKVSV